MSKLVHTTKGRIITLGTLLVLGLALTLTLVQRAESAPYANPFWGNASASPESAIGSVANLAISPEGVDMRTGELFWDHFLFRTPGVRGDLSFAFRWRSMINGSSQMGRQILPSFETTSQYVVINQQNRNGPGGHAVDIRRPSGRTDRFLFNRAGYTAPADVFDVLTAGPGGTYILTDKWQRLIKFNVQGMPTSADDPSGNKVLFTYNALYQITSMTELPPNWWTPR